MAMARVVTTNSNDRFVFKDLTDFSMKGICLDLWERTSRDLNITYSMEVAKDWLEMVDIFGDNQADIIVERMDDGLLQINNITE